MNYVLLILGLAMLAQKNVICEQSVMTPGTNLLSDLISMGELTSRSRVARSVRSDGKVKVSRIAPEESDAYEENNLKIRKRQSGIKPEYHVHSPEYCLKLGSMCGNLKPKDKILCLSQCVNADNGLTRMYANFIPSILQFLCLTVSTLTSVPEKLIAHKRKNGQMTANQFRKMMDIQESDVPEFAKTSANALVVTMIKLLKNTPDWMFKALIERLESIDSAPKGGPTTDGDMLAEFGSGKFTHKHCDVANLHGDAVTLSEIVKSRNCLLDILMPGYYLITQAPTFVRRQRIKAKMRGLNIPLFIFTGVGCCIVPYKENGTIHKCNHAYDLITPGFGPIKSRGRRTVCGAIPDYQPVMLTGDNVTATVPEEGEVECDPEDALYSSEGEEPCKPGTAAGPAANITDDYYSMEADTPMQLGGRGNPNIPNPNIDADIEAAYGENAPGDDEFIA